MRARANRAVTSPSRLDGLTTISENAFAGREHEGEGGKAGDNEGNAPRRATWLRKMFCDAMESEVVRAMGAVGTLTTLILLGSFLVLTCVNTEVVILGEGLGTDVALIRSRGIEEVDVLVEADVILLGGAVIALRAFVGLFSCMDA